MATNTPGRVILTCGVGEVVLLALYPVLERLCISPCYLYLLLDRLGARVRHADRHRPQTASMAVAKLTLVVEMGVKVFAAVVWARRTEVERVRQPGKVGADVQSSNCCERSRLAVAFGCVLPPADVTLSTQQKVSAGTAFAQWRRGRQQVHAAGAPQAGTRRGGFRRRSLAQRELRGSLLACRACFGEVGWRSELEPQGAQGH
jgi:hypothetical protein